MRNLTLSKLFNSALLMGLSAVSMYTVAQSDMTDPQSEEVSNDKRDPHAYSAGTTLTSGPYALEGGKRLTLADEYTFYSLRGDRVEYNKQSDSGLFDLQGWYGTTYDKLVIKTEGDITNGSLEENQTDILWGHAVLPFWDAQVGIRSDYYREGESRQWLALGLQGLAPYWFELDMTAYVGEGGNTAFALEAEYELLLTQKLIVQPRAEATFYGKDDQINALGSGLSSSSFGIRVRYEFTRQFAPYIGVEWNNTFGNTADYAKANGESSSDTQFVAGLRFWF